MIASRLDAELSGALNRLAAEHRTTLFTVLAAVLQVLLSQLSGQRDLVVGTAVAGRDHVDLENQVGFYLNLVAIRGRLAADDTVRQLLLATARSAAAAFDSQDYPYDRLVGDLGLSHGESRNPLFDVLLIVQNNEAVRTDFADLRLEELAERSISSKYDLNFMFEDRPTIELKIEYSTDLFDRDTVAGFARRFLALAAAMAADPDLRLHELRAGDETAAVLAAAMDLGTTDREGW